MSEPVAPTPPRAVRIAAPIMLVLALGTLVAAILLPLPKRQPEAPPAVEVPAFSLTERSGAKVSREDLLGKVWVASFIFTRCSNTCPKVTGTMHQLQTDLDLAHQPDLRLVSFTMDPEYDTPEVLKQYAARPDRPADPDKWLFLTGSEAEIHQIMKKGFRLAVELNQKAENVGVKYNHGTFIFAVDKRGQIRGHFDGIQGQNDETGEKFRDSYTRLVTTVKQLLAE